MIFPGDSTIPQEAWEARGLAPGMQRQSFKEGLRGQPLEGMAPRSFRMSTEKQQKDTRESGGASTVSARVSTLETMKKSRGVENCIKEESGDQIVEGLWNVTLLIMQHIGDILV